RPHQRRDDPQVSAPARSVPRQSHQGVRIIGGKSPLPCPPVGIAKALEVPRRREGEARRLEVSQIAGRQAAAIYLSDCCNHAIRRRHSSPLASSSTHDFPIGKGCFLGQAEYPIRKTTTPVCQPLLQSLSTLIRSNLLNA